MSEHSEHTEPVDDASVFNYRAIRNWCAFAVRAIGRHRRLVLIVAGVVVALAALTTAVMPRTYEVQTQLLAQRNQVLVLPGEEGQPDKPAATAIAEMTMRRENLVALAKETNLLKEWDADRAPILKFKDAITGIGRPAPTDAERLNGLVEYLGRRLTVVVGDSGGTVTIAIRWPSARMAYRLVDAAQRGFLEARHVQETSTIAESASILEGHAVELRRDIDHAVSEIEALREKKLADKESNPKGLKKPELSALPSTPSAPPMVSPARPLAKAAATDSKKREGDEVDARRLSEVSVMVDAKRRDIDELEGFRQRRLADLQAQLEDKRASYTDAHPEIVGLRQSIAAASVESVQVKKLRGDLGELQGEYERLGGRRVPENEGSRRMGQGVASRAGALPADVIRIEQTPAEERDPEIEYARARLKFSIQEYQELQQKIQRAHIDLDTAEAAFKYRYTVVLPPMFPRGPIAPKTSLILLAAFFGGIFCGLLSAVGLDLRRGVLRESWQVEQFLALPVLTEVRAAVELPRS